MIVRDEERPLGRCLDSVGDLVDEIVVVDTGSLDETKAIARNAGARIGDFTWCQDFAAARNESIRLATSDWICWMDADEYLDQENRERLRTLRGRLPSQPAGIIMRQRSTVPAEATHQIVEVDHVRVFPRHPQVRWRYRVHEQISPSLRNVGAKLFTSSVVIDHVGYCDSDRLAQKAARNLGILKLALAETPDDPFVLFYAGDALARAKRFDEAIELLEKCLTCGRRWSFLRKARGTLVTCHLALGNREIAREHCREALAQTPDEPQLLVEWARLMCFEKRWTAAEDALRRALASSTKLLPNPLHRAGVESEARRLLEVVCNRRMKSAISQHENSVSQQINET